MFGAGQHRMSDELLEKLISDYLGLGFAHGCFAWQGGEPTLMGLEFFRKVVSLQNKYKRDAQVITNTLQTNGLLLDRQWCEFLYENEILVGISLDGPREIHDHYRLDRGGRGTFDRVMAAIENCRNCKVEFNILVLLNNLNVERCDELFDFFTGNDFRFLQFIPALEMNEDKTAVADFAVKPEQYGRFLCRLFDRWKEYGVKKLSIRFFDSILSGYTHGRPSDCTFDTRCNSYVVVEHNGDVFCCDFFVTDKWRLGNIKDTPIEELFDSRLKRDFARAKRDIANKCFTCRYLSVCRGGCLKDRDINGQGYRQPSYFCESYRQFFDYALDDLIKLIT